jgi:phage tail tape-measure protein
MDVSALEALCQRLDELATVVDLIDGDPTNADLHREASAALRDALAEIKRLQAALRDALGEIERLRSDAHQHRETSDALRNVVSPTDWLTRFQERKRALTRSLGGPEAH